MPLGDGDIHPDALREVDALLLRVGAVADEQARAWGAALKAWMRIATGRLAIEDALVAVPRPAGSPTPGVEWFVHGFTVGGPGVMVAAVRVHRRHVLLAVVAFGAANRSALVAAEWTALKRAAGRVADA